MPEFAELTQAARQQNDGRVGLWVDSGMAAVCQSQADRMDRLTNTRQFACLKGLVVASGGVVDHEEAPRYRAHSHARTFRSLSPFNARGSSANFRPAVPGHAGIRQYWR